MTEQITLPQSWCGAICRNAMSEVCIKHCAIKRDTSYFQPKPDLKLADMPKFPDTSDLTREERFASVTVYLAKVVEELQGEQNEPIYPPIKRPNIHSVAGSRVPSAIQVKTVLHDLTEAISPLEAGKKREDTGVTTDTVAQSAD